MHPPRAIPVTVLAQRGAHDPDHISAGQLALIYEAVLVLHRRLDTEGARLRGLNFDELQRMAFVARVGLASETPLSAAEQREVCAFVVRWG